MRKTQTLAQRRTLALRGIAATVCAAVVLGGPIATVATASTAGRAAAPVAAHQSSRGTIVSVKHVQNLSVPQVLANLQQNGFDRSQVKYGIDAYRIVYRTIDVHGAPTTASGLVVLPRSHSRTLRVINYTHGTMAGAAEAPSVDDGGKSTEGLQLGSAGYAVVEPDYLGLGEGPGYHPYLNSATEQSASVDMVRAAFAFSHRTGRVFDPRILVTGFSQGGKVAMLLGEALQGGQIPGLKLAAVAPISGPYDLLNAELPAIVDGRLNQKEATYYLTYLFTAWNRIYHLYDKASDVFNSPYDKTLAPLYDGKHSDDEIFAQLPDTPQQLLKPAFLAQLKHPTGALAKALKENDNSCTSWQPGVPVHIFASHGDEVVAIDNAYHCQQVLADHGVETSLTDVGNYGHNDSGRHGLTDALRFFRQLAPPR